MSSPEELPYEEQLQENVHATLDDLERVLRDCLDLADVPAAELRMAPTLVDGLLSAGYGHEASRDGRGEPWPSPHTRAGKLNVDFLMRSAERFMADIATAVILLRPPDPEIGRRHGVDPSDDGEVRCLCGWRSPNATQDRVPISHHYLAVIELGKDLGGDR
jgi:hypothetical protein